MPAVAPLTATLFPYSAEGISLYVGQPYTIDLFSVINPLYFGERVVSSFSGDAAPIYKYYNVLRISGTPPAGLVVSSNYGANRTGYLNGTPTTVGTSNVLFKIELSDYFYNSSTGSGTTNTVKAVGYVSVPITIASVPTSVAPAAVPSVILPSVVNAVKGTYLSYELTAATSAYPQYWSAVGLPPGINLESNRLEGAPTETNTTLFLLSLRYKPSNDDPWVTETKYVSLIVAPAAVTSDSSTGGGTTVTSTTYLGIGGIDVFLDLQSMALSLDLPKAETVIAADAQIVNATTKQLVIKPDQILDLNVRFTKGGNVVDPSPTDMRFGIGTKIGGPLLMLGSTFTKVGSGSGAYFKMRVTSDSLEFDAIQQDYYDEDAVEQIIAAKTPGIEETPAGLCELEFSTGSGATLATFRSDSLAVLIRRSLLAGS